MTYSYDDMAAILENPNALTNYQLRATDAHKAAGRCDWIRGWFDEVWFAAKSDTANAQPARDSKGRTDPADVLRCDIVALRGALEVEEIYSALANLPYDQRQGLFDSIQGQDRVDQVNATLATIPAGAVWLKRKAERDAMVDAANAEAAARVSADWEAGMPARVLESIESAGSTLSPGKPKGILATGEISADHMELLRTYRTGVEALLTARATATAPRLIA